MPLDGLGWLHNKKPPDGREGRGWFFVLVGGKRHLTLSFPQENVVVFVVYPKFAVNSVWNTLLRNTRGGDQPIMNSCILFQNLKTDTFTFSTIIF